MKCIVVDCQNHSKATHRLCRKHRGRTSLRQGYYKKRYIQTKEHVYYRKIKWLYGLTKDAHKQLLISQNNTCKICKKTEEQEGKRLAIDHCHRTLKVRGLLCENCNRALGLIKEDTNTLLNMIEYVKETI